MSKWVTSYRRLDKTDSGEGVVLLDERKFEKGCVYVKFHGKIDEEWVPPFTDTVWWDSIPSWTIPMVIPIGCERATMVVGPEDANGFKKMVRFIQAYDIGDDGHIVRIDFMVDPDHLRFNRPTEEQIAAVEVGSDPLPEELEVTEAEPDAPQECNP